MPGRDCGGILSAQHGVSVLKIDYGLESRHKDTSDIHLPTCAGDHYGCL